MSWNNPDSPDDPANKLGGGDWGGMRPSFDNPMTWSIQVGRIARHADSRAVPGFHHHPAGLVRGFAQQTDSQPLKFKIRGPDDGLPRAAVCMSSVTASPAAGGRGGGAKMLLWPLMSPGILPIRRQMEGPSDHRCGRAAGVDMC